MSRTYGLDADAAKAAGESNYITHTGKYIGTFEDAVEVKSKQNTEGIELSFVSNIGQKANFLTLWTFNEAGEAIYGYKVLQALMTCMRLRELKPDQSGKATTYPALLGKPIGVLLQREPYEKSDGSDGSKFNIVGCFDPSTELTAKEILERSTEPKQLASWVAQLSDRPKQARKQNGSAARSSPPVGHPASFDGDIPF